MKISLPSLTREITENMTFCLKHLAFTVQAH